MVKFKDSYKSHGRVIGLFRFSDIAVFFLELKVEFFRSTGIDVERDLFSIVAIGSCNGAMENVHGSISQPMYLSVDPLQKGYSANWIFDPDPK